MKKITDLGNKIAKLKKRKRKLQQVQAQHLIKELRTLLGKSFSPELALIILKDSWHKATEHQKEEWQSMSASFRT